VFRAGGERDPGVRLDCARHPRLADALARVAARIGTRPVDAVFMTPGADVAVYERGSMLRQLAGRSERCLILGVAVLDGMKQGELKAVLAHEYGHFANRDTAGGGFALAVRRAVFQLARSLAEGGAATWYNPAWWFVNGFHRVFLRVSQGASRLQEILADRWAALAYGGAAVAGGLRHVIERSVRFDAHADRALREVIDRELALANLYRFAPREPAPEEEVRAAVEQALAAEPSPYDSHPCPRDRIAWVAGIAATPEPDDASPAWELFEDREALERLMTTEVRTAVAANHGVTIPAEEAAAPAA
jgi:Zn-dependent protease with chaperone function